MKKASIFILPLIIFSVFIFDFSVFKSNASIPSDFGLKEGDLISAIFSDDPDVYIINDQGYKRLFLNPEIFKFYSHLGGFANIKLVTPEIRDSFPTSGFFRNCEDNDQKVYGTSVEGEDSGRLHWINKSGDQAVQEDPDFFKKVFCINRKEFNWYPRGTEFKALKEVPQYHRSAEVENPVICHHPSDDPSTFQTIRVAAEALDAHFQHGDTRGACSTYVLPTLTPQPVPTPTSTPITSIPPTPILTPAPTASSSFSPTPTPTLTPSPTASSSFTPTPTPVPTPSTSSGPASSPQAIPTPTPTPAPTPTTTPTPTGSALAPPQSVTASLGTGKISVVWSGGITSKYKVYRCVASFGCGGALAYSFLYTSSDTSYDDYSVISGTVFRYKIYGCDSSGSSCSTTGTESNEVTYSASTPTPTPATGSVSYDNFSRNMASVPKNIFSRDLYLGIIGSDVKQLQALLVNEVGYSADLITGYFGRITRDAVKRLQEKYGVKPISGYFGAITRKTLNAVLSGQ